MSATIVRTPQDFLNALKTDEKKAAQPLTLEQVTTEIERLGAALDAGSAAGPALVGAVREAVEAQRADLIRQQFILVHGFVPDADGNPPIAIDEKAIAAKVIEEISAAPAESSTELQSELEPPDDEEDDEYEEEFDLDEQIEVLNEIDEADASPVVSPAEPTTAPTPVYQITTEGIFLDADICTALRASVVAEMPHVTAKITARIVELVLGK